MLAKIHIVVPIKNKILSARENRFPAVDHTSQTPDMEKNIWNTSFFITLSYLARIVGSEQMLGILFSLLSVGGHWRVFMG